MGEVSAPSRHIERSPGRNPERSAAETKDGAKDEVEVCEHFGTLLRAGLQAEMHPFEFGKYGTREHLSFEVGLAGDYCSGERMCGMPVLF
jgi:hypothetical protein